MAAFDQQVLVDMFRQSFAPIAQLGAGRLQLAQAVAERDYRQRQSEGSRAQALQDHIAGIMLQNQLAGQRESALEDIRGRNAARTAAASTGAAMAGNLKAAAAARAASEFANARQLAANLGLDTLDPADPEFVNKVTKEAAVVSKKHRGSATQIHKELTGLNTQLAKLSDALDLPEARQVQIARPLLLAAATDDKKKAEYAKLTSLDDIFTKAADEGASDKIAAAIQREQMIRNQTFERKARPLQARQTQLQSTLRTLESKGISPDYDALSVTAADMAAGDTGTEVGLEEDIANLFAPDAVPTSAPANVPVDGGGDSSGWLTAGAGAGITAATSPRVRGFLGRMIKGGAGKVLPATARGLGRAIPFVGPAMLGYGAGEAINSATNNFIPNSLAGLVGSSFSQEESRQRAALATIDQLMRRSQNPAVSGRLRALKYSPVLNDEAIARAIGVSEGVQPQTALRMILGQPDPSPEWLGAY